MRLIRLHPEVAYRSCNDCKKYLYSEDGTVTRRVGIPVLRPANATMPCAACPKQPYDVAPALRTPETAVEMTDANREAYAHYRECRAVGVFPDDPIVRMNAASIRAVEDAADRVPLERLLALVGK